METLSVESIIPDYEESEFGRIVSVLKTVGINLSGNGPYICGGSVLKAFIGMPLGESDIDIFCSNLLQYNGIEKSIRDKQSELNITPTKSVFSINFMLPYRFKEDDKEIKVQLINKENSFSHSHIDNLISEFDINVCRIYFTGTDFVLHDSTLEDINDKVMSVDMDMINIPYLTFKRILKYSTLGFKLKSNNVIDFFNKFFKEEEVKKAEQFITGKSEEY